MNNFDYDLLRKVVLAAGGIPIALDSIYNLLEKWTTAAGESPLPLDSRNDLLRKIATGLGAGPRVGDNNVKLLQRIAGLGAGYGTNECLQRILTNGPGGGGELSPAPTLEFFLDAGDDVYKLMVPGLVDGQGFTVEKSAPGLNTWSYYDGPFAYNDTPTVPGGWDYRVFLVKEDYSQGSEYSNTVAISIYSRRLVFTRQGLDTTVISNPVGAIDVSFTSNKVTHLYCHDCLALTSLLCKKANGLLVVDLANLPVTEVLDFSESSGPTTVDLSRLNNPSLTTVNFSSNPTTEVFDLTGIVSIGTLMLNSNSVMTNFIIPDLVGVGIFDGSACPMLTSVDVRGIDYTARPTTFIGFGGCIILQNFLVNALGSGSRTSVNYCNLNRASVDGVLAAGINTPGGMVGGYIDLEGLFAPNSNANPSAQGYADKFTLQQPPHGVIITTN